MQNKIGISSINLNGKLGSIITVMIVVKPNFFRENHISSDPDKLVTIRTKLEHIWIEVISPVDIEGDIQTLEAQSIINTLNTYPRFWKHDINIEYSGDDLFEKMELPHGLKSVELNNSKWNISKNHCSKVCKLAKRIAEMCMKEELEDIKKIWGNFGDIDKFVEDNPENPHVRG